MPFRAKRGIYFSSHRSKLTNRPAHTSPNSSQNGTPFVVTGSGELEEPNKSGQKSKLGRMHFLLRRSPREKRGAIDLRKRLLSAGTRRPLDLKRVAPQRTWVAIAFERPGVHKFSG